MSIAMLCRRIGPQVQFKRKEKTPRKKAEAKTKAKLQKKLAFQG